MSPFELFFLIVYIGFGVGIPLVWYAKQVGKENAEETE